MTFTCTSADVKAREQTFCSGRYSFQLADVRVTTRTVITLGVIEASVQVIVVELNTEETAAQPAAAAARAAKKGVMYNSETVTSIEVYDDGLQELHLADDPAWLLQQAIQARKQSVTAPPQREDTDERVSEKEEEPVDIDYIDSDSEPDYEELYSSRLASVFKVYYWSATGLSYAFL
jgi:hypothetical protein